MIYALVEYINKNGRISMKAFTSKEDSDAFVAKLKTKYIVTVIQ